MNMRKRQAGMSIPGMLAIAIMVGFFVMCAIRMVPGYFEYLTVKEIVTKVATEFNPEEDTIADIRRKLANLLNTNQVYGIQPREIEVFRKDGKTYIDARYEVRIPVLGRIDAVMNFDDLEMQAGK
ncbi:DUF4845 domain-containing protein [Halieaceae bacterium]|nr:DUF4845 domain-containing protein [Halieaceae bacterium]